MSFRDSVKTAVDRVPGSSANVSLSMDPQFAVPGQNFKGTFRLPDGVQPTYLGKYAKNEWGLRARLDVLGVDPGTGWIAFRVGAPR